MPFTGINAILRRFFALNCLTLGASLACLAGEPATADERFDGLPLDLPVVDFLPDSLLKGDGYSLAERVSNDGFQNTYTVHSDYGVFTVTGTEELRVRLQEIKATEALQALEESDEFKQAAKSAATGLVEAGKALVETPAETTKAAARGVGQWMRNVGSSFTSEDPHQDNALETAIGYDMVKRRYALEMGVDPYTSFEPFQESLSRVAKAATAGSMVTSFAIDIGTSGSLLGTVVDATNLAKMKGLLMDNPPASLARINRQKLIDIGIAGYQADALLKNYNYTPTEITLLCEALSQMGDIQGREIFVAFATSAPDPEVANFMRHYAVTLALYMNRVETGDIVDISGAAWMLSDSKTLVGAFPMDYVAWTPGLSKSLARASDRMDTLGASDKKLFLTGKFSSLAREALEKEGWKVTEYAKFTGGEPRM